VNAFPSYNALSYEWGPKEPPFHWIKVNNGYLQVRQNLWDFFQVAAAKMQSDQQFAQLLWIDAISINQMDELERAHQVKQMGDIYRCASTVFVWVGLSCSQDFEPALKALKKLCQEAEEIEKCTELTTRDQQYMEMARRVFGDHGVSRLALLRVLGGASEEMKSVGREADKVKAFEDFSPYLRSARPTYYDRTVVHKAVQEVSNRTYWTRMWITQEIICARKACLIVGHHLVSWPLFRGIVSHPELYTKLNRATNLVKAHAVKETNTSICEALFKYRGGKCSDLRDKVYAILALVPGGRWFPVDYSVSLEELFCQVIMASYGSKSCPADRSSKNGASPGILSDSPTYFNTRLANLNSLANMEYARTTLEVPFCALDHFLATKLTLGLNDYVSFASIKTSLSEEPDGTKEHSFLIGTIHRFESDFTATLRIRKAHEGSLTCSILFEVSKNKRGYLGRHKLSYQTPLPGILFATDNSVSLPLTTVVFLIQSWFRCTVFLDDYHGPVSHSTFHTNRLALNSGIEMTGNFH
jgi:hypothetical protein